MSGLVSNLRFSFESKKLSPERSPFLSSSTSLTPMSQPFSAISTGDDSFLTSLEIHDDDEEANYLLLNHVGLIYGDNVIPPPPPRKKSSNWLRLKFPQKVVADMNAQLDLISSGNSRSKEICFICNDTLDSKMDSERILALECGDRIHSDCLDISVECALDYAIETDIPKQKLSHLKLRSIIFPTCEGSKCREISRRAPAAPIDNGFVTKTLASASLKIKLSAVNPDLMVTEKPSAQPSRLLSVGSSRQSLYFIRDNATLRLRNDFSSIEDRSSGSFSHLYGRPPSSHTSISSFSSSHGGAQYSLEQLKSFFLQHFVNIHPRVDMVFAMSLGPVRLVDQLNVGIDGSPLTTRTVYLFADYIAVINENLHPMLFPLNRKCLIDTPKTSVIRFVSKDPIIPTMRLHSDEDAIIEKWGIVVSDRLLLIPAELFTSTILTTELKYTSFKPSLADLGLNVVANRPGTSKKKSISPIFEKEPDSPRSMYLPIRPPSGMINLEKELMKIGLLGSPFPSKSLEESSLTSPLRIDRNGNGFSAEMARGYETETDTDIDSDEDVIQFHRKAHRG